MNKLEVNIYALLNKLEVKMAGYWPSSFFCVIMERDKVEVNENAEKNETNISSHVDRTSFVNKGFDVHSHKISLYYLKFPAGKKGLSWPPW